MDMDIDTIDTNLNFGTDKKLMKNAEKLSKSAETRKKGNDFFKEGKIGSAIKYYHVAAMLIKDIGTSGPFTAFSPDNETVSKEMMDKVNAEKALTYNNLACKKVICVF